MRHARWAALAAAAILFGCDSETKSTPETNQRARPLITTTLYPVHVFAERIAGDLADVHCLLPAGADALHWRPDDQAIRSMQSSDLIVFNGANAEPWAFALALPFSRVEETAAAFRKELIAREGLTHSHGGGESHTHDGYDPHTWLDPRLAARQAERVRKALTKRSPEHEKAFQQNYDALLADLESLHQAFAAIPLGDGDALVAMSPVYDYLARQHGWHVVSLTEDPTSPPSAEQLATIKSQLGGRTVRAVLWPTAPDATWAEAMGAANVSFPVCAAPPADGAADYFASMRTSVDALAAALK